MCRRGAATALAMTIGFTLAVGDLDARQAPVGDLDAGQDPVPPPAGASDRARLLQTLDSLRPLVAEARAALDARTARDTEAARRAAAAAARVDTLRVGLVSVVAPTGQAVVARELFTEVWTEHYALIERSPALEEAMFVFQWSDDPVPIHVDHGVRSIQLNGSARRSRAKAAIRNAIGITLNDDLRLSGARIDRWVSGNPLPREPYPESVYRVVATRQSRATRACLTGDSSACASALSLGTGPRDFARLSEWYTPEERRLLVARLRTESWVRFVGPEWGRCVDGRDQAVCDDLLASSRLVHIDWAPLPGSVRETVLAYAVERGGAGAWERLVEHPDMEPAQALEHASGLALPELLAGWRARLVEHRPGTFDDLVPATGRSLAWILLFAAFAMRSTRCRFG